MSNLKINEKGITLIALIITIIVLLILVGISITGAITGRNETKENKAMTELYMVQHAVLETNTKLNLTNGENNYPGEKITGEQYNEIKGLVGNLQDDEMENYYILGPGDLQEIGITNSEDTYIVNYKTGEVFNYTKRKTDSGEILYIF